MAKRLSGWARLWIVLLVPIWAVTTFTGVTSEMGRWQTACDWPGCATYGPWYRFQEGRQPIHDISLDNRFAGYAYTAQEIQIERNRREGAVIVHNNILAAALIGPLLWTTLAFVLLMIAKSAAMWVWRGFRAAPNP